MHAGRDDCRTAFGSRIRLAAIFPGQQETTMAIDRKRSRLVSFRLSEQEYQTLHNSTLVGGARSVSDFARRALCTTLDGNGHGTSAQSQPGNGVTVNHDTLEQLVT